jgi:diphosphomevalonate decarboxylase
MPESKTTAIAHPNIAFIKYWGNRDDSIRLPSNGSISMNLEGLTTTTTVRFTSQFKEDSLTLNNKKLSGPAVERVRVFLDLVRSMAGRILYAEVTSENNFPTGAGIASSASAFAALALAATKAIGLNLSEAELSRLARHGSGSACRSIPNGFVEWVSGDRDENSYAASIAPAASWDLVDCIALVTAGHKEVGSTAGHRLANTSPLQSARVEDAPRRLDSCRSAIFKKDFQQFAEIIELDSNLMHAVMMTSTPPLFYWEPQSLEVMRAVRRWRGQGIPVCYTLDAGPNVHVICLSFDHEKIKLKLEEMGIIQRVFIARPGSGAIILANS